MSLHTVAKHMAAHGRGPDTQLVHMSPREVAGLQSLAMAHGGSLTINPHTGLVEAGFLDRMLPALLGAGLMFASGGAAAALTPELIGLGVGGLQTARTGSLTEGLKAGLGAYGGAGLAGGFAGAAAPGTPAPTATPTAAATPPVTVPPAPITAPTPTGVGPDVSGLTMDTGMTTTGMPPSTAANYQSGLDVGGAGSSPANMGATSAAAPTPPAGSSGIGSLTGKEAFKYGSASLGSMADTGPKPMPEPEKYTGPLSRYRMADDYRAYEIQQPNPYYRTQYESYAGGGTVEQMSNANAIGQNTGYPQADITGHTYATPWQTPVSNNVVTGAADTGVNRMTGEQTFAGGGIASLGSYSDGGQMLKGPGDGMSDSIPATINGKQPARLANDEFVVPADVVSHIGNGSSDAGAKQLYKMMDRVRQQRTGKKKQAPQVNPSKVLPA